MLFQLRDNKKTDYPNKWGIFGGRIEKGEIAEEAATRELKEELGLYINKNHLKLIMKVNLSVPRARSIG